MKNDISEFISQESSGKEEAENSRIQKIADELSRRCQLYEEELRASQKNVRTTDIERYITDNMPKKKVYGYP